MNKINEDSITDLLKYAIDNSTETLEKAVKVWNAHTGYQDFEKQEYYKDYLKIALYDKITTLLESVESSSERDAIIYLGARLNDPSQILSVSRRSLKIFMQHAPYLTSESIQEQFIEGFRDSVETAGEEEYLNNIVEQLSSEPKGYGGGNYRAIGINRDVVLK